MSRDGQLIRKTNLPVNASEYKYILAAFPNSFYETRFTYENHANFFVKIHEFYDKPKAVYEDMIDYYPYNVYDKADRVRKLQDVRMNINYKKIGKKWRDELISYYKSDYDENENLEGIKKEIDEYIKFVKRNKIIVAEDDIQGDILFQDEDYSLIYENNLFWEDSNFVIVRTTDIWEITEKVYRIETENISLEEILPDISNMEIKEILKKCFENKILVHFEYEKSYFEKFGIIEKFENDRLILREIDKGSGIFVSKSEILIKDISFLFVRNCRVLRIMG